MTESSSPLSPRCTKVQEDDARRIADGCVMAGEGQSARFSIHAEDRDVVAPLIARVEELAGGVEVEAARIIPSRPLVADESQLASFANREDSDTVV